MKMRLTLYELLRRSLFSIFAEKEKEKYKKSKQQITLFYISYTESRVKHSYVLLLIQTWENFDGFVLNNNINHFHCPLLGFLVKFHVHDRGKMCRSLHPFHCPMNLPEFQH